MSWSFNAMGKGAAVAAKADKEFAVNTCVEPEETVRQFVKDAIVTATSKCPDLGFKVDAYGSQSSAGGSATGAVTSLNAKLEINSVQFVEEPDRA